MDKIVNFPKKEQNNQGPGQGLPGVKGDLKILPGNGLPGLEPAVKVLPSSKPGEIKTPIELVCQDIAARFPPGQGFFTLIFPLTGAGASNFATNVAKPEVLVQILGGLVTNLKAQIAKGAGPLA
jgi:hypothetical protein